MFSLLKKRFYGYIPTTYTSAYIRLLYLRSFLKTVSFRRALDAGCGPGLFTFYVAERFPEAHISGYDISLGHIDICNQSKSSRGLRNVNFEAVDLTEFSEVENYDLIFSVDVLEHIPENLRVFKNIYDALMPGGVFYLAMPYEPGHRYLFSRRYFGKYIAWSQKEHVGRQYSPNHVSEILSRIGFHSIESGYTFGFWGKLAWEVDMLTEGLLIMNRILKPLLFVSGYLDTLWRNGPGSYAIRVIARK